MRNGATGFTLIELVVVIVILGILAATAVPKFIDLSTDATTAKNAYNSGATTEHNATKTECERLRGVGDPTCQ